MWDDFENALAWFKAAPPRWINSAKSDLSAAAEWILNVLEGDFSQEQSVAQAVTGTIISMIPLVDQICDVRDIVANCKKLKQDASNKWHWFALVLCLIGLFPSLGSLVKGSFKVLFAYGRKGVFSVSRAALDADIWKATIPFVEAGVRKLNDFLARPAVRKTLAMLKIDNPYKFLADQLRKLSGTVSVRTLTQAFDVAIGALKSLLKMVQRWGTEAMKTRAGQMLEDVNGIRKVADEKIGEVVKPIQDWLNRLAQRLDVEWRVKYRADVNVPNPHGSVRMSLDAEIEQIKAAPPEWIKIAENGEFPPLEDAPLVPHGHADISGDAVGPLENAYKTFSDIKSDILPPGTVIYRVLAPKSLDNSICWMTKAEFDKLRSKGAWRDRFAVWMNWNVNGEFLTYTVPPGHGLPVWRGKAASQQLKDQTGKIIAAKAGKSYWLEGGAEQIVVNPSDLKKEFASARSPTGWGYDEDGLQANLIGVPILETNWRSK
jgi:hypothetical protein